MKKIKLKKGVKYTIITILFIVTTILCMQYTDREMNKCQQEYSYAVCEGRMK